MEQAHNKVERQSCKRARGKGEGERVRVGAGASARRGVRQKERKAAHGTSVTPQLHTTTPDKLCTNDLNHPRL